MAVPTITIYLTPENTIIEPNPIKYNAEIIIDLTPVWDEINCVPIEYNKIQVQTSLSIPIFKDTVLSQASFSVSSIFAVKDIINHTITQTGYFEGVYDPNREIISNAQIWQYEILPIV
ncbi:MAG: hypothetical protein ACRCWY_12660 [Cellulosilyticaceae bacterium]